MKYFFVLGNNPTLSAAELTAVLNFSQAKLLAPNFLVGETSHEPHLQSLIKRLGGTIKLGELIAEVPFSSNFADFLPSLEKIILQHSNNLGAGKINFGFSVYGDQQINTKALGLTIKKKLQAQGISSRLVTSQEKTLSSVVVEQNKLLKRGLEIVLIREGEKIIIGKTLAVQDFKGLSRRDYGRPARDDHSGMLPPKLAQIMLNLAELTDPQEIIVDPFCGSGTILSEALLMGYQRLFGSDLTPQAVSNARENIAWLKKNYPLDNPQVKIITKNVINLAKFIKPLSASAIVTEPYLGPQRGLINFNQVKENLESLYSEALAQFRLVLKPGGRVVMIWPSFYGERPITPDYSGFKMLNPYPSFMSSPLNKNRPSIIYGRPGQKVFREIVVLEKE